MQDWIVTTLRSIRLVAEEKGYDALTDEMDIAILVAAEECQKRRFGAKGQSDVGRVELDSGKTVVHYGPNGPRRYC